MAKNSGVTNPLNVGAMYQIGAAGSGNLRSSKEIPGLIKTIGNIAVNWYSGIQQNKALVRKEQNQTFTSVDNTLKDANIIDEKVIEHKANLVAANKILTSARWNLYKSSDTYKGAETLKNQTLYAMKNLGKNWTGYVSWKKAQISLFKGEMKDKDGIKIDYKNSTTLEEQYNASLLASGQLDNAIMSDDNGDLVVVMENVTNWDDPSTKNKTETVADYKNLITDGKLTTVKLKDFPMIADFDDKGVDGKAANNKTHHGNDFIKTYAQNGAKGYEMDKEEHAIARHTLSSSINNMSERDFMKFVFDGDEFGFTDGSDVGSVFDKLVKDSESQIGIDIDGNAIIDDPTTTDIDESKFSQFDTDGDGKIGKTEKKGAEAIIKQVILSGDYKRDSVIDLYQKKGEEIYQTKYDRFERNKLIDEGNTVAAKNLQIYKDYRTDIERIMSGGDDSKGEKITVSGTDYTWDGKEFGYGNAKFLSGRLLLSALTSERFFRRNENNTQNYPNIFASGSYDPKTAKPAPMKNGKMDVDAGVNNGYYYLESAPNYKYQFLNGEYKQIYD